MRIAPSLITALALPTALAAGPPQAPDPTSRSQTTAWTGAYAGVNLGVIFDRGQLQANNANFIAPSYNESIDFDSVLPGLQLGYNYQFSNDVVLGIEGDFTYPSASGDYTRSSQTVPGRFDRFTLANTVQGSVRGRFGRTWGDALPYVTLGLSFASTRLSYQNELGDGYGRNGTQIGWILGGGLEYQVFERVSIRAEYLYADYGDLGKVDITDISCVCDPNGNARAELVSHSLRAAINYRF